MHYKFSTLIRPYVRVRALCLGVLCAAGAVPAVSAQEAQGQPDFSKVDGTVVAYIPSKADKFIGAPALVKLPNGDLLAGYSEVGPSSDENCAPSVRLYRSADGGHTWAYVRDVRETYNATLFTCKDALYLIGTNRHDGDLVIRRSVDGGLSWSAPLNPGKGLLLAGKYMSSAGPVLVHGGRVWYVAQRLEARSTRSRPKFSALLLSASVDADLLDAASWRVSNPVAGDASWLEGDFANWFGGSPVPLADGGMAALLSVSAWAREVAACLRYKAGDNRLSFDSALGFAPFDGGSSAFVARRDETSGRYLALVNAVPERYRGPTPERTQNTLALVESSDLKTWSKPVVILHRPNPDKIGFANPCWLFDGQDIVFVAASAADDQKGGAFNGQSANCLTFHRLADFRNLSARTAVNVPAARKLNITTERVEVSGCDFKWMPMQAGTKAFSNRDFLWETVPSKFSGWHYTQLAGGVRAQILVKALRDTDVFVAARPLQDLAGLSEWESLPGVFFAFNDRLKTKFNVYRKHLKSGESVWVPQMEWHGAFLLAP